MAIGTTWSCFLETECHVTPFSSCYTFVKDCKMLVIMDYNAEQFNAC